MALTNAKTVSPLPLGTKVQFTIGLATCVGRIVEDRGKLGFGGRRLYRIEYISDQDDLHSTERPEEELVVIPETN